MEVDISETGSPTQVENVSLHGAEVEGEEQCLRKVSTKRIGVPKFWVPT
jgi:hypothetical protein